MAHTPNHNTDELGLTELENKQIEALSEGASREDVASLSRQELESAPELIPPSDEDMPREEPQIVSNEDLPVTLEDDPGRSIPPFMEPLKDSYAGILESYISGDDVITSFMRHSGNPDQDSNVRFLASQKADQDAEAIKQNFVDDPGVTEDELLANAEVTQEMINNTLDDRENVSKQVVDAASTVETDPEVAEKIQVQIQLLEDVQGMLQDYSALETTGDILTSFIPGKLSVDNLQLTGSIFGSESVVRDMIIGFKSLPAEEQLRVWPSIKGEILDTLPKIRALPTLAAFLDPVGEKKLEDFNSFWATIDTADLALLGYGIARRLGSLGKQLNAIKTLRKLENTEDAADANAATVVDETGQSAKAAGIDEITAYNNTAPFDVNDIDEAYASGISSSTISRIRKFDELNAKVTQGIKEAETLLREDLLNPQERAVAESLFEDKLVAKGYENIRPVKRSGTTTTYEWEYKKEGQKPLQFKGDLQLTVDDATGSKVLASESALANFFLSPSVIARGETKQAVREALRLDSASAKLANVFRQLQREALAPIIGKFGGKAFVPGLRVRKKLAELDEVLLAGDEWRNVDGTRGKVFTIEELRAGVNGVPLDEKQIESYYKIRSLMDNVWINANEEARNTLKARGMKEVSLTSKGGPGIGKPFAERSQAQASINLNKPNRIWDDEAQEFINTTELDLKEKYEQGYVLTKLNQLENSPDGELFDMALVKRANVRELPQKVTHYKPGYIPKISKDGYWFVKQFESKPVNGTLPRNPVPVKTLRYFNNRKEAREWAEEFRRDNPDVDLRVLEDRELEKQSIGSSQLSSTGGLYTGPRAQEEIPFGKKGRPGERLSALESIQRNLNHLQNHIPRNLWRMGMQRRWVNTAKELNFDIDSFNPSAITDETADGRALKKMGELIEEWSGFPTKSEMSWDAKVASAMEWAAELGVNSDGRIMRGLNNFRHKDPIAIARSITFHTLLGWFNPVQIWVQAQGASIALSLSTKLDDPLGAVTAVKNQFALGLADLSDNPEFRKSVSTAAGLSTDELDEMVRLWRKTGLRDSILATADHAAAAQSYGVGRDALRRASDAGLLFYRAGELFNRRTSFLVALKEFKKANPGKAVDDAALKGILTRANNMMLNMSKANRAQWQKGIWSLTSQFLQVQAKILESIIGKKFGFLGSSLNANFTAAERAKIMFGQLGLYGAAGVPMGNFALNMISELLGVDQADIEDPENAEKVKALNEGFWGWLALTAFGADIDISRRGAVVSGLENFTYDLMFGESTVTEAIIGAFGEVPHRFYRTYNDLKPMVMSSLVNKTWPTEGEMTKAISDIASIASSWNNVQKAQFMDQFNMLLDRNNNPILIREFSTSEVMAKAIGFGLTEERVEREARLFNQAARERKSHITNQLVKSFYEYSILISDTDSEEEAAEIAKRYANINSMLIQSVGGPEVQAEVWESVRRKLRNGKDKFSKTVREFLKNKANGQYGILVGISTKMVSQGLQRTGVLDERDVSEEKRVDPVLIEELPEEGEE